MNDYATHDELLASEGRIVERIGQMDTRINGRIKKLESTTEAHTKWIAGKEAVSNMLNGFFNNGIVQKIVIAVLAVMVFYSANQFRSSQNQSNAVCQSRLDALETSQRHNERTADYYVEQFDALAAGGCTR